jgi:uncharacterized protein with GYD domain
MATACILVRAEPAQADVALKSVKAVEGVVDAYLVFGRYDLVVVAEAESLEEVIKVAAKVNACEGVRKTETLLEAPL